MAYTYKRANDPIRTWLAQAWSDGLAMTDSEHSDGESDKLLSQAQGEISRATTKIRTAMDQLDNYQVSKLGAPIGVFQDLSSALWELAYWTALSKAAHRYERA